MWLKAPESRSSSLAPAGGSRVVRSPRAARSAASVSARIGRVRLSASRSTNHRATTSPIARTAITTPVGNPESAGRTAAATAHTWPGSGLTLATCHSPIRVGAPPLAAASRRAASVADWSCRVELPRPSGQARARAVDDAARLLRNDVTAAPSSTVPTTTLPSEAPAASVAGTTSSSTGGPVTVADRGIADCRWLHPIVSRSSADSPAGSSPADPTTRPSRTTAAKACG